MTSVRTSWYYRWSNWWRNCGWRQGWTYEWSPISVLPLGLMKVGMLYTYSLVHNTTKSSSYMVDCFCCSLAVVCICYLLVPCQQASVLYTCIIEKYRAWRAVSLIWVIVASNLPSLCVGMLELVTKSSTLREIQTEHGVTGSFKDKPLSEWLMRNNPTESSYQQVSRCKQLHILHEFIVCHNIII